jgi:hypothetical protein
MHPYGHAPLPDPSDGSDPTSSPGRIVAEPTIANYLSVMVKVGDNDKGAIREIPRGSFSEDAASLSATVPMRECAGR